MVHGIRGDDAGRAAWVQLTDDLLGGQPSPTAVAWRSTFDAIAALQRADFDAAIGHLAVEVDDPDTWWSADLILFRPWYAAVWVEAAALARRDDVTERIERARHATRDNPIASAIVERAAALAKGDLTAVEGLAGTFEALGCPYQQARTHTLATIVGG